MAKTSQPYNRRARNVAGALRMTSGADRAALRITESTIFDAQQLPKVYLGAQSRSSRYLGVRTDAQLYLGALALF